MTTTPDCGSGSEDSRRGDRDVRGAEGAIARAASGPRGGLPGAGALLSPLTLPGRAHVGLGTPSVLFPPRRRQDSAIVVV